MFSPLSLWFKNAPGRRQSGTHHLKTDSAGQKILAVVVRLCLYLLIGSAALSAKRHYFEHFSVAVVVPKDQSETNLRRVQDEAILIDQAYRIGWADSDPVIFHYLVKTMRALGETGTSTQLFKQAKLIGLQEKDQIVRARLLDRTKRSIETLSESDSPSMSFVRDYYQDHQDQFLRSGQIIFAQLFATTRSQAGQLRAKVESDVISGELKPENIYKSGSHFLGLRGIDRKTTAALDSQYGGEFLEKFNSCPEKNFCDPIRSLYGWHVVYIIERQANYVPPFDDIQAEVRHHVIQEMQNQQAQKRIQVLRKKYRIVWQAT